MGRHLNCVTLGIRLQADRIVLQEIYKVYPDFIRRSKKTGKIFIDNVFLPE